MNAKKNTPKKRIVISGYYGFGNAGDEAMLAAIIENLHDEDPNIKITVISGNPEDTKNNHKVNAVYRLNYPSIIKKLKRSSLLISGGGSLLQDITSNRSIYYYLSIMALAKNYDVPVMLYAQGIGPVKGTMARKAAKYVTNKADLITVRDEGSFEELKALGVSKPPIYVTADPVLSMNKADKKIGSSILSNHNISSSDNIIGVSVREWQNLNNYKKVFAETCDFLINELDVKIVFLPMQIPEDFHASQKIIDMMNEKDSVIVLNERYTTTELLSIVGNCDLLIGIRLHALIFATIMQIPVLGVSYDPKIDSFLETIEESNVLNLKALTTKDLITQVLYLWKNRNVITLNRLEHSTHLRGKSLENVRYALDLINKNQRALI